MALNDYILEQVQEMRESELETRQHILEYMVMENMKEWEYLDHCIKYKKDPVLVQEGLLKKVHVGIKDTAGGIRSIITRLRALTRRNIVVLKTLFSHVQDVSAGFSGKFRKSGAKKSASQIAHENLRGKLDPDKKLAESQARVKVPYEGKIKQDEIELINSVLLIKEFNDDDSFEVDLMGVNYVKNDRGKARAVSDKGEGVKSLASLFVYTNSMIYFIKHPEDLEELCDLITEGFKMTNGEQEISPAEYAKKVNRLTSKADNGVNGIAAGSKRLTMKELTQFQSKLNKLEERLDFAQNGNVKLNDVDPLIISSLNNLVGITERFQFGLTSLSNAMQKVHLIDLKFMNSITDRDTLSKFVYDCIQNGIPPKYIAYNTWLIANESIRGSASRYKPVGGQTRCVFFPNDNKKEILKIATSGIGITSNKNEIRFAEFLKRSKEQDMIDISALVTNTYAEDAILAMERVVDRVGKHPDLAILNEIKGKYRAFTERHPELRLVISDFNDGNVMWSSDKDRWVCIDYGLGKRDASNQTKIDKRASRAITKYKKNESMKESSNESSNDIKHSQDDNVKDDKLVDVTEN